ncbi:MAG: NCS2 family permease, partial [Deltaproteobacteria bacterium]|nr:NCS2 family permease [Deltaproteobacteria bacterium]
YGINTVSLFAFVFLVMLPAKLEALARGMPPEVAVRAAFRTGLAACFLSALIELSGAGVAGFIRRHTPRAALLSTLAGIAISFIAIDFAMRTFEAPLVAVLPLVVILATYFGRTQLPGRIPGGAWALGLGTVAAWLLTLVPGETTPVSRQALGEALGTVGFHFPLPVIGELVRGLTDPLTRDFLVPVILPMGLFNVLGSLQNLESAEAAGDRFPTAPSMAVNGLGSVVAAAFGSCFPTTLYIGHPGWKALGARAGYSVLNAGFFAVVALSGVTHLISALVPIEAGMAIVLWIGIVITAQAFDATPRAHAPAVAVGLFPAIAAWGALVLTQTLGAAGLATADRGLAARVLADPGAFVMNGLRLPGLVALSQGFMITCLVWSAASACLIDRRLDRAALWLLVGAVAAFFGFIHAGRLEPTGGAYDIGFGTGARWALAYAAGAAFLWVAARVGREHAGH